MKCFGGPGTKKKACRSRKCTGLSVAHATASTHTQSIATTGKIVLFTPKYNCKYSDTLVLNIPHLQQK